MIILSPKFPDVNRRITGFFANFLLTADQYGRVDSADPIIRLLRKMTGHL